MPRHTSKTNRDKKTHSKLARRRRLRKKRSALQNSSEPPVWSHRWPDL